MLKTHVVHDREKYEEFNFRIPKIKAIKTQENQRAKAFFPSSVVTSVRDFWRRMEEGDSKDTLEEPWQDPTVKSATTFEPINIKYTQIGNNQISKHFTYEQVLWLNRVHMFLKKKLGKRVGEIHQSKRGMLFAHNRLNRKIEVNSSRKGALSPQPRLRKHFPVKAIEKRTYDRLDNRLVKNHEDNGLSQLVRGLEIRNIHHRKRCKKRRNLNNVNISFPIGRPIESVTNKTRLQNWFR